MKKFLSMFLTIALVLSSFSCLSVMVSAEGETGDIVYTEVRTVDDLYNVRNNLAGNYILMNDIDLTEATSIDGKYDFMDNGWNPIGSGNEYSHGSFSGVFDGNGYEISGLRIDVKSVPTDSGNISLGLFSDITGTVKNLTVRGSIKASVSNAKHVGAISGYSSGGTIENCHSYCDILISNGSDYIGGIVGIAKGNVNISGCSNNSSISGRDNVGGIVGYAFGEPASFSITNCYNTGTLSGYRCGGIIGFCNFDEYSSSTGSVSDCYNIGVISGTYSAGIVGCYDAYTSNYSNNLKIKHCYNRGALSGTLGKCSIASFNDCAPLVSYCYYLEGLGTIQSGVTALNEQMMLDVKAYIGFDFEDVWVIDEDCVYPYPQLKNNNQTNDVRAEKIELKTLPKTEYYINDNISADGGVLVVTLVDGTVLEVPLSEAELSETILTKAGNQTITVTYRVAKTTFDVTVAERPFGGAAYTAVWSVEDLYNVRHNLSGNYLLMNDIDLTEATSIDGIYDFNDNGWNPIGSGNVYGSKAFSGIFDGNGYEISGLRMDVTTVPSGTGTMYLGLFASVTGTVKNLTVSGSIKSSASKDKWVGAISGYTTGTITNCHSYCDITVSNGIDYVGGIVGYMYDSAKAVVSLCSNNNSVTSNNYVGGIVGYAYNRGSIYESYNTADLYGNTCGGILGYWKYPSGSYIYDCYNCGSVNGMSFSSGIIGSTYRASDSKNSITDCYNVGNLSGNSKASIGPATSLSTSYYLEGLGTSQSGATALNEQMMRKQASFSGFDFVNTWYIDSECEYPYPQLKNNVQTTTPRVDTLTFKALPKTTYHKGETLDVSAGVITVKLIDGTTYNINVADADVSDVDLSTIGSKKVTVTYKGVSITYDITVKSDVVSIAIDTLPTQTKYFAGQDINKTGLLVLATYYNGTTGYIDDYTLSYDKTVGNQTVTVEYESNTATFDVTYISRTLTSIEVTQMPDKTTYVVGDEFDSTGMVVTAFYDDGTSEIVVDYDVSKLPTKPGVQKLIVSYGGKRVIMSVTVIEKEIDSIAVTEPTKLEYLEGEPFDPTGMEIVATYNNGKTEIVTDYEVQGFGDFVGIGVVTIICDGHSYDLVLTIHVPEDDWVLVSAPTCTEDGFRYINCTVCGNVAREEVLEALDHDYSTEWTIDVPVTCYADGSKSHHCSRCESVADVTAIKSTGHNMVNELCQTCFYTTAWDFTVYDDHAVAAIYSGISENVIVPEMYNGLPVTEIGEGAFAGNETIKSIEFSKNITTIGDYAFYYCPSLESVAIPDNVTSIGAGCFEECYALEEIIIPSNVTTIGDGAIMSSTKVYCYENSEALFYAILNELDYTIIGLHSFVDEIDIDYENKYICLDEELCQDFTEALITEDGFEIDIMSNSPTAYTEYFGTGSTVLVLKNDEIVYEYTVVINGDTNGDSVVDALDAAQVALVSNGQKTIDGAYKMAADNNHDDEISIEDYQAIVNKVVA